MTSLFTWNETFLTQLQSIDEQHQQLVGLVNELGELVISAETIDPQIFAVMRDAVLDYAGVHFSREESLLAESRLDPRYCNHHRREHRSFLSQALSLGVPDDSFLPERATALLEYLVRWLACHILDVDQSMARQLRAIHAGESPEQAFENDARHQTIGTDPLLVAMNRLFHVVSQRNRELHTLNLELEQRVQQRTLELEQANHQLQLLSTHDDLTGLPNRRSAILSLQQLWLEAQRYGDSLSVLMLDADHFKQVNDRFGHAEGDALLKALALRLRAAVRHSDIVCRLGGDEFLVICPRTASNGAAEVARKILVARQPFHTAAGFQCWDGALSIGLATGVETMNQSEDLLQAADEALYRAKRQGGARMAEA